MYYTLSLMDLACVAVIIIGFAAFVKMLPKNKRGTRATINALISQKKRLAIYGVLLTVVCVAFAAPSIIYFLNGSAAIEEAKTQAVTENYSYGQKINPPSISTLLKRGNEEQLIDYLRKIGESGIQGWSAENIRLDHEGSRSLSTLYCQSSEKDKTLRLADLESLNQIDQINISTYVQALNQEQAISQIEDMFSLPDYTTNNATYFASQPYKGSQGTSFECKYKDDLPWKVSGNLRKEDTCKGEDIYSASITLVRYVAA